MNATTQALQPQPNVSSDELTHQLATEMATGLYSIADVGEKFGLSASKLKRIAKSPHFKRIYAEAKALWDSDGNVQERVRRKSALLLEDSILPMYSIIHNNELAPAARIEAFAKLRSTADMEPTKGGDGTVKENFTLNINIGGEEQVFTIDGTALDVDEEPC